jgi:hypothetical protein
MRTPLLQLPSRQRPRRRYRHTARLPHRASTSGIGRDAGVSAGLMLLSQWTKRTSARPAHRTRPSPAGRFSGGGLPPLCGACCLGSPRRAAVTRSPSGASRVGGPSGLCAVPHPDRPGCARGPFRAAGGAGPLGALRDDRHHLLLLLAHRGQAALDLGDELRARHVVPALLTPAASRRARSRAGPPREDSPCGVLAGRAPPRASRARPGSPRGGCRLPRDLSAPV